MTHIAEFANTPAAWSARADIEEPWAACGWSQESQAARLARVVELLDPVEGDRLLDFGCGTGELSEHLPDTVDYVGYDWASGMVIRAGHDHPGRRFQSWQPSGVFDLVACVGCFNLPDRWSKQRTWHTIRNLWETTGCRALAVSLYAGDDPACLSYDEADCGLHLLGETFWTRLERWRPNDIIVLLERSRRKPVSSFKDAA